MTATNQKPLVKVSILPETNNKIPFTDYKYLHRLSDP